jgi:hypothetical protein
MEQADDDAAAFPVPLEMPRWSDALPVPEWADWFDCGEKTMRTMLRKYEEQGRAERWGRVKWRVRLIDCPIDYIRQFARARA